jgi:acetyl esterase
MMQHDATAEGTPGNGLDPEIHQFVSHMSRGWAQHPPLDRVSVPEARRIAEQVRSRWTRGGPSMAKTAEMKVPFQAGAVRIRVHDSRGDEPAPALVYLHGGGWTIFSIDTHDRLMREYAARAGIVVVGVDYSLSPEARFPRAIEETVAVIRWLRQHGAELNVDPARIALGGDSAGAAMTIAACVKLRDENEPDAVKAMLLNYGAYDASCSNESYRRYGQGGYMWGPGEMAAFWRNYLGDTPMTDPLACPIHADVRGLPPAYSAIPDCDVMYEESIAMAEKLRRAGVPSHVAIYAGATHSFLEAVSIARISDRAFADASRWLSDTLRADVGRSQ